MNPFKNLQVNLIAKGGWAIVAVLAICITTLGIYGEGELARQALNTLTAAASFLVGAMAFSRPD